MKQWIKDLFILVVLAIAIGIGISVLIIMVDDKNEQFSIEQRIKSDVSPQMQKIIKQAIEK